MKKSLVLVCTLLLVAGLGQVGAVTIYPPNYSFESPAVPGGDQILDANSPDWKVSTGYAYIWGPDPAIISPTGNPAIYWTPGPTDGTQVLGWVGLGSTVYQLMPDQIQAGVSYILKADAGDTNVSVASGHPTYTMGLYSGNPGDPVANWTLLSETTGTLTELGFITVETPAYIASGNDAGKRLGIKLTYTSSSHSIAHDLLWDNVRVVDDRAIVAIPTFSVAGGTFSAPQAVVISCETAGAEIRYTTDGSDPTQSNGTVIASGASIQIAQPTTLKAKAWATGSVPSDIKSDRYVVLNGAIYPVNYSFEEPDVPGGDSLLNSNSPDWKSDGEVYIWGPDPSIIVPTGNPAIYWAPPITDGDQCLGWVQKGVTVYQLLADQVQAGKTYVLMADAGDPRYMSSSYHPTVVVALCYGDSETDPGSWTTLSETTVTLNGYGDTFTLATPEYIGEGAAVGQRFGVKLIYTDQGNSWQYDLTWDNVRILKQATATPTFTPDGGAFSYQNPQMVTINCATPDATIRYTIDGSEPTQSNGTVIASGGTIQLTQATTLKARAWSDGMDASGVKSAKFVFTYDQDTIPEGNVTIDGDLSDWPSAAEWSPKFVFWNGTGPSLDSTTKAKFAWNDAQDMLYVAVVTDEAIQQPGGHLVIGPSKDLLSVPTSGIGSTQLCFDTASGENEVLIRNEVQYFKDVYNVVDWGGGVTDGVQAKYSYDSETNTYTYEVALPLWTDWRSGMTTTKQTLSANDVVYVYICMENTIEGGNGTNLSWLGNPAFYAGAFDKAAALTLVGSALHAGDANGDGMVDVGDLGILAANYGQSGKTWAQGDFNNDGLVDVGDLGILAANYGFGTNASQDFSADYAKAFGTAAEEDDAASSSLCSGLGLPLIAGLMLMGLMLVKLEE